MRSSLRLALILSATSALVACQRFHPAPLEPEQSARAFEGRSLSDPRLREFLTTNLNRPTLNWPLHEWDFEALSLAAFYFQPRLALAEAQWRVAEAATLTA